MKTNLKPITFGTFEFDKGAPLGAGGDTELVRKRFQEGVSVFRGREWNAL
jgi:hypothetical protein